MTGKVVLVEVVVVDLYFAVAPKVVWHEHDRDVDVLQLPHPVVHAPHEHGEKRLRGAEQFPLRVLHFEPQICKGAQLGQAYR